MKRLIFVTLAFLFGCSGVGSGGSHFIPANPESPATGVSGGANAAASARHRRTKVRITMTVPRRRRGARAEARHPATISSLTQSVSIAVNGGTASVFNATPSSQGCSIGAGGTTCTFSLDAPVGSDTFVVSTYNAADAGGVMLDRGGAVVSVATGKANTPAITLGPVVSVSTDSGVGSLRYAIGSANPGDTIMMMLPAGTTITLATPLTVANRLSIAGPGVTTSARRRSERHDSATYTGITIGGAGLQQLFVIKAGATVGISGLILSHGNATTSNQPGGAIYNAGTLALVSDVLTANVSTVDSPYARRAPHEHLVRSGHHHPAPGPAARPQGLHPHCSGISYYGGAVYNHGSLSVTGSTFDGNTVSSINPSCNAYGKGGAIYNDEYGILNSSGNLYTNNGAYYGGAVYNNSEYGSATFASDTFSANLGCTAATLCTSDPEGYGAAIYDDQGPGISVTGSTFTGNVAGGNVAGSYGEGAALDLETGTPSVTGSTFTSNVAGSGTSGCSSGEGGAIYLDSSGPLELDNDTFTGNQAGGDKYGYGGAIYGDEPINGSNDTFTSNTAYGTGSACYANGYAYGGAVYGDDGASLSGTSFKSNSATGAQEAYGGALYSDDPSRLTGDTFTSNSVSGTGPTPVADTYAYGGAIDNQYYMTVSNTTFSSNSASAQGTDSYEAYGGAIYNQLQLASTGDTFTSNSVTIGGASADQAYGGAVYSYGTPCCGETVTMISRNDAFSSNSATATGTGHSDVYGGAIYSYDPLTVSGDTFTSNTVTGPWNSYGGAISNGGNNSSILSSTFTANAAASAAVSPSEVAGGAIDDEGTTAMSGDTITGNSSVQYGGGIYEDGSSSVVSNATLSANSVSAASETDSGGGAIFGCDSFTLANSAISGNSVTVSGTVSGGGGVYNYAGLTMTGTTISGNAVHGSTATSGGGGILNNDDGTYVNDTITGNTSSIDGGAYESYGSSYTIYLTNDTLFGNSAAGLGGNIDNVTSFTTVLADSIVAGGSAATGADINNSATLTSDDYNIIQTAVTGTAIGGTTTHNQAANPLLLALANNGGPTLTNADQASSPGQADIPFSINNGSVTATCGDYNATVGLVSVDQRGFTRGAGGRCDVGAYELAGAATSVRHHTPTVRGHHKRHRHHPRLPQMHEVRPAQR